MKLNYKKNYTKSYIIINIVAIIALSFIFHNLFKWFPSFITTIFPVNESLYEHLKLIFITPIIVGIITYVIYLSRDIKINNFFFALLTTVLANIIIFYAIYLPIYYRFGENMIVTIILYIITIIVSQIFNYYLINCEEKKNVYAVSSIILIVIIFNILLYLTYRPMKNDFFIDPNTKQYGFTLSK